MKKALVLCVMNVILWHTHAGFAETALKLCAAYSPPWIISANETTSDVHGLTIDVMKELFFRADIPVQLDILPFKRCLTYVERGEENYDGCFMTIKNAEREGYADFTESYVSVHTYLFYHKDRFADFQWDTWEDLQNYSMGIQRGFRYGQDFTVAAERLHFKLESTTQISQSLEKALYGRIDFVLVNKYRFQYLLDRHPEFVNQFKMAEKPVGTGEIYIAISKKSSAVKCIPTLNKVIEQMKADGSLKALIDSGVQSPR